MIVIEISELIILHKTRQPIKGSAADLLLETEHCDCEGYVDCLLVRSEHSY